MDFSETVIVCDIKVGISSELNRNKNLYEYQRSRSFIAFTWSLGVSYFVGFIIPQLWVLGYSWNR